MVEDIYPVSDVKRRAQPKSVIVALLSSFKSMLRLCVWLCVHAYKKVSLKSRSFWLCCCRLTVCCGCACVCVCMRMRVYVCAEDFDNVHSRVEFDRAH